MAEAKTAQQIDNHAKTGMVLFDESQFTQEQVSIPQLKIKEGLEYIIKITSKIYKGKVLPGNTEGKVPDMVKALEMRSGIACEVIVNKAMADVWAEKFPKDAYVGEIFKIQKLEGVPTKGGRKFCPTMILHLKKK